MHNNPLHTEPRAARFGEIKVVRRGPVNGGVIQLSPIRRVNNSPRSRSEIDHAAAKEP